MRQSVNLLSNKGPKATDKSHQYAIIIVHRVQTMYTICINEKEARELHDDS